MKLPNLKYGDGITSTRQFKFGGYNHSLYAKDGDIYDMKNMTSDIFPLITQRNERTIYDKYKLKCIAYRGYFYQFTNSEGYGFLKVKDISDITDILNVNDSIRIKGRNEDDYLVKSVTRNDGITTIKVNKTFEITNDDGAENKKDKEITVDIIQNINREPISTNVSEENYYSVSNVNKTEKENSFAEDGFIETIYRYNSVKHYGKRTTVTRKVLTQDGQAQDLFEIRPIVNNTYIPVLIRNSVNFRKNIYFPEDANTDIKVNDLIQVGGRRYRVDTVVGRVYIEIYFYSNAGYQKIGFNRIIVDKDIVFNDDELSPYGRTDYKQISKSNVAYLIKTEESREVSVSDEIVTGYFYDSNTAEFDGENTVIETKVECISQSTNDFPLYYVTKTTTTNEYEVSGSAEYIEKREIVSIGADDAIYYVTANGALFYDGVFCGMLSKGKKVFASTGAYLYILPDNAYLNTKSLQLVSEHIYFKGFQNKNTDINYYEREGNTFIQMDKYDLSELNGKPVYVKLQTRSGTYMLHGTVSGIENDNKRISFSGSLTQDAGYDYQKVLKGEEPQNILNIAVGEEFPELKFICAANNRIWGCDEKTIYCTSFGNPLGWFEYPSSAAGNDADAAWSVEPFSDGGEFTACAVYNDTPIFFKEDRVYKVYGDKASSFSIQTYDEAGVLKGAEKSVCVMGDGIYYLSRDGIVKYNQNGASNISQEFFERFESGEAGNDGVHYYVTLKKKSGDFKTFVYNTEKRLWSVWDDIELSDYFFINRNAFTLSGQNILKLTDNGGELPDVFDKENEENERDIESFIEFADHYNDVLNKKAVSKLYFRMSVEAGSEARIYINYDSEKDGSGKRKWKEVKRITANDKKTFILPVIPQRCDHFRIKIEGKGKFVLYGMSYEYYVGSFI